MESRVAITSNIAPDLVGPYFIIALKEAGQLWRINHSDPTFLVTNLPNVGGILREGFLSLDNRYFYLAYQENNWMVLIDLEMMTLRDKISTGDTPQPASAVWEAEWNALQGHSARWRGQSDRVGPAYQWHSVGIGSGLSLRSAENSPYAWADALFGYPFNSITTFKKKSLLKSLRCLKRL